MSKTSATEVFVDICTQRDYLAPEGAHPVGNALNMATNVRHLMAFARWVGLPVLSCVEVRRPRDVLGRAERDCVAGTPGQRKPHFTLMPRHQFIDTDNCPAIGLDVFTTQQQAILPKMHRDPFANPKLDRLLTELPGRRLVLFGVALETTIRLLTLGLLLRHRPLTVIVDACGYWDLEAAEMTVRQLDAKACELRTTADFLRERIAPRLNGAARRSRFVA